jgi:hypothetical protein
LVPLGEYSAKKLRFPEDLKSIFAKQIVAPTLIEPTNLDADAPNREQVIWEASLKSFARCIEELRINLTTLFTVIWGQCSEAELNYLSTINLKR